MMKKLLTGAVATVAILGLAGASSADPVYDFSSLAVGGLNTNLGPGPVSVGPITAYGLYWDGDSWEEADLVARDDSGDNGLGVCSPNEDPTDDCAIGEKAGGGDYNELSELENTEAILLFADTGFTWTGLYVSSLDSGGTGGSEEGTVCWALGACFSFGWGDFGGAVEGDLFSLGAFTAVFDPTTPFVAFFPGSVNALTLEPLTTGDNNDYLVWGASGRQVPEPATLLLFGVGLAGAAARMRRRSQV